MTQLSRSARDPRMLTLQCDVCIAPWITTNRLEELERSGWRTALTGAELDVCPLCRRRRTAAEIVPRSTRSEIREDAGGALPNLVVIGAAKCGTSSLHSYLDLHPEISMSEAKEPQFFSDPDGARDWLPYYKSLFDAAAPVRGEASTMYTRSPMLPGVPERMAALIPDARLVYLARDPVERALSAYVEARTHSNELRPLEDAFADLEDPYNPYVAASRYAEQLRLYLDAYPSEQILVLQLEEMQADPDAVMARVFGFLGVEPVPVDTSHRANTREQKKEYPPLVRRLRDTPALRAVYRLPPERRERVLAPVRRMLGRPLRRPELSEDLRARLEAALAADAAEFRSLTGLPLTEWSV